MRLTHPERTPEERRSWKTVFYGTMAVIITVSTLTTNLFLVHQSHVTHSILSNGVSQTAAQAKTARKSAKVLGEQLAYAAYLSEVNDVVCVKLHQINPANPQCPILPDLHIAGLPPAQPKGTP